MLKDVPTLSSKRCCFRIPFANERVSGFQTLLKSARHHYYPFFSSIRSELSWKKSPSVWYEILRLFFNPFTGDDKISGSNMKNFPQQFQTPLSHTKKIFSGFFIAFVKCAWNLEHFQKKRISWRNYFRSYWRWKTCLLIPLEGLASEQHSLMNVLTGSKHCWNQHGTNIPLFSRQF